MHRVWLMGVAVAFVAACGPAVVGPIGDSGDALDASSAVDASHAVDAAGPGGDAARQDSAGSDMAQADTAQPDSSAQPDAASGQDAAVSCIAAATPGPGGMRNGQACLSCHASMSGNLHFTLGGTLYSDANGTSRVGGATIRIVDNNNQTIDLATGSDGAFYTTRAMAFPITVEASKCPDTQVMADTSASGDCNSCHNTGNRVHLP